MGLGWREAPLCVKLAGMTALGPIAWAAIRTLPGRAEAWAALTGWQASRRPLDAALARQLGAADAAGLPLIDLFPPHGQGGLRLIECEGSVEPLRSLGWAAAELSVADLDGIAARAESLGFRLLGAPRGLGSTASIRACQIADPGGAVLYCADVRGYAGTAAIHRARLPVDRVFIAVLASRDLEASRAWYARRFGVQPTSDHAVPIPILATAWAKSEETSWRISSQQLSGDCLLEIDQYPAEAAQRSRDGQGLPGGVIAFAFSGDAEARLADALTGPDGERLLLIGSAR